MKKLWKNLSAVLAATFVCGAAANGQPQTNMPAESRISLIQMENVPLTDAIENLARQAENNFTVDPKLVAAGRSSSGDARFRSPVSVHWENLTAEAALARLLKERDLFLVKNPQTGVAKITASNSPPTLFENEFFNGSKEIIPTIQMNEVPLEIGIDQLASKAGVKLKLDGSLTDPSTPFEKRISLAVRFKDVTAAQALAAICDQHNLKIAKTEQSGVWRVSPNK